MSMENDRMVNSAATSVYTPDITNGNGDTILPTVPIQGYEGFIRPADDARAKALGDACAREIAGKILADFEKTEAYCRRNGGKPDQMVHVSTFVILDGMVYMTYYANTGTDQEDPTQQAARLAFCPLDNPEDMTILELQKVGDVLDGREITHVYDTILMYKGGDELYLMWTASPQDNYHRLYRTFSLSRKTLGPIRVNRFRVGDVVNDFSISGMKAALSYYRIPFKAMWSDIGIMQKLSTRMEAGETWYYSGAYSGNFNCIIKSRDLITWEYVAAPDFPNNSRWENATYVVGDRCYYFVRQQECEQGFLTYYDLCQKTWATPFLIADAQSRSDFVLYDGELYLIHAPVDRDGFGIVHVDQEALCNSTPLLVVDMKDSCFYPYVRLYGDTAYISYTVARKHIRLARFQFAEYLGK